MKVKIRYTTYDGEKVHEYESEVENFEVPQGQFEMWQNMIVAAIDSGEMSLVWCVRRAAEEQGYLPLYDIVKKPD
jgi:hypothetical protein